MKLGCIVVIVVDTSALVAILLQEDDADRFILALERDDAPIMSAATFVELNAVMVRKRGPEAQAIVDRLIELAQIAIEPLTAEQARLASNAYCRYPVLNLGDTFSYALAKDKNLHLLFKGQDFTRTDIGAALPIS